MKQVFECYIIYSIPHSFNINAIAMFCLFSRQKSLENFRSDLKLKNEVIRQLIVQSNATIFLLNNRTCIPRTLQTYMYTLGLTLYTALANKDELTNETNYEIFK